MSFSWGFLVLEEEIYAFHPFSVNSTSRPAHQAHFQLQRLTSSAK